MQFSLIYEFIFYFRKVENFLNNKGIEFINRKMTTIDINNLRKSDSDMNQGNNEITDSNNPDDKTSNEQKQQVADVVSGYD